MAVFPGIRSGCLLFILGASVAIGPLTLDQAWAKSDRGAERSSDRGGGHKSSSSSDRSSRGKSDNAPGRSGGSGQPVYVQEGGDTGPGNGKAKGKVTTTEVTSTEGAEAEEEVAPNAHGKLRSQMGALNAAHANANALANAAPNSRVGLIAQYARYYTSQDDLAEAQAYVDSLEVPDRSVAEIEQEIADNGTSDELEAELAAAQEYEAAVAERDRLQAEVDGYADTNPEDLLAAAANKPLNGDVINEVNRLLDIDPSAYEAEEPPAEESAATTEGDTTTTTQ